MKRNRILAVLSLAASPLVLSQAATPPTVIGTINPNLSCGGFPTGVVYDPVHKTMWVAWPSSMLPFTGPSCLIEYSTTKPWGAIRVLTGLPPQAWGLTYDPVSTPNPTIWITHPLSTNMVTIVDTVTATIVAPSPFDADPDCGGVCFSPAVGSTPALVWTANLEPSTMTAYLATPPYTAFPAFFDLPAAGKPRWCVYDAFRQALWWTASNANQVQELPLNPPGSLLTLSAGSNPWGIAYDPINLEVWWSDAGSGTVDVLPPGPGLQLGTSVGVNPNGVIYGSSSAGVAYIWVINGGANGSGTLTQINAMLGNRASSVALPAGSYSLMGAFDPVHETVWVTNEADNVGTGTISIFQP